ncbi:hypothetical protein FEM48_ZijujUnG0120400 [Ziziphus jujuba var. spinosa]|uniref:Uncharacterized protein n=1 Tax=Ziziphus jujuba var. spinosa TaxID=714518 RepID=A0A978U7V0_ZIZJJ|nr:hypothetical protein FEM48_ZijujUnG0120400 [Ziziphus jujuba var. spinosa]
MDTLFGIGIHGQPMKDGHNKAYKSFLDIIEGKEGSFCETLHGKHVDYSGHSVIVIVRQQLASDIGVARSKIHEKSWLYAKYFRKLCKGIPYC